MDGGVAIAKFLLPQVPSLASTALWHSIGQMPNSDKWDLRTTLTVQVLRSLMGTGNNKEVPTVGKVQSGTLKDPGVKGKTWVAKDTLTAPKDETIRDAVFKAMEDMKVDDTELRYSKPELADIEVEWTGYRPAARKDDPLPNRPEKEKYQCLMAEPYMKSKTTVLYFHGGAYYLCDPATHRQLCSRLAKECEGRVCSTRYRLSPQQAFPGQLLDALQCYLSLLYPTSGNFHDAVEAKHIVLAGDSAGGNLAFALLQFLLQLHRVSKDPTVRFHGKNVKVPLPAGCCANSGWFDVCRSMPSLESNAKYDYLPPPSHDAAVPFPADDIWPTKPPRGDLFCDLSLLDHPLVSMMGAESWKGAPPLWIETGQEMLSDEDCVVAARAAQQGVKVQFEQYEAMPHCFSMLIQALPTADRCLRSWGDFCRRCVEEPESIRTNGVFVSAKTGKEAAVDVTTVDKIGFEKARALMKEVKGIRLKGYEKEGKTMPKPAL